MSSAVYNSKSGALGFPTTIGAAAKMLKYQHIAPAPLAGADHAGRAPRKYTPRASNAPYSVDQTQSVQRRNARERNRVKQVNNSFAKLRQHIPQSIISDLTKGGGRGPHKKISKVDTLRIAVEYIRRLQDLVEDINGPAGSSSSSSNASSNSNSSNESLSNISFSSSSSSSSAGSPPPSTASFYAQATSPLPSYQQQFSSTLLTPNSLNSYPLAAHLDEGCASPTSSFNSSMSFDSGTFEPAQPLVAAGQLQLHAGAGSHNDAHLNAHLQLKFEPYDHFQLQEEDCQPDDEEILDYISLWQEQ